MALVRNHPSYPNFRMKIGNMMDFSGSSWIYQEELIGSSNGVNANFRINKRPIQNTEQVFKDGMLMTRDVDYAIDYINKIIRFSADSTETVMVDGISKTVSKKGQIPQLNSIIRVNYKYEIE